MIKYKMKIVNKGKYVSNLPTRYSERRYFSLTDKENESQEFDLDFFENLDINWVEDCYKEALGIEEDLTIELVATLSRVHVDEE